MQKQQYNPRVLQFMGQLSLGKLNRMISLTVEKCEKCLVQNKNHYCMQEKCKQKQLICWSCDVNNINSQHYMHQFSYVVPLFSKDIFSGMTQMKYNFTNFQKQLQIQIQKIYEYIRKLEKIDQIVSKQLDSLHKEEVDRKFKLFQQKVINLVKGEPIGCKLSDVLTGVSFISSSQCLLKEQQLRQQLLHHIQNLKWIVDPQKQLKSLLRFQVPDESREAFISSRKNVQFCQIDSYFRLTNEYYTQSLATHKVQLKLQLDLLNKIKFYEAFIYHFKDCRSLSINNATIGHIKTPLSFKSIKYLQLNCNVEESTIHPKIQSVSANLSSLIIKRLREDDIKNLKIITMNSTILKQLSLDIFNKTDLSGSKDLIEFLNLPSNKHLTKFTLRIRTQSGIKRAYGYLSKFHKQNPEPLPNLGICLVEFLRQNTQLTNLMIEGVKPLESQQVLNRLESMKYLMNYQIQYDNMDILQEVGSERVKNLNQICKSRKKAFNSLAKNLKYKRYDKNVMKYVLDLLYG